MNVNTPSDLASHPLRGDERWEMVARIADTPPFRRSLRLRSFLLYVCEQTLLGREEELHEAQIGCQVFGKAVDYNPGDDNVVRVTARLLRKRLSEYFEGPGKDEPLRLVIPTGRYVPQFESRRTEPVAETPVNHPEPPAAVPQQPAPPRRDLRVWILAGACGVLAIACAALLVQNAGLRTSAATAEARLNPVLTAVFDKQRPTKIIVSDCSYSLALDLTRSLSSLYQYIDAFPHSLLETPRPGDMNEYLRQTLRRQYTSVADLNAVVRLVQASAPYWDNTRVVFARNVVARDLKGANLILIGSKRSNPWVEMFEGRLNFQYQRHGESGQTQFVNRDPREGELPIYKDSSGQYAHVALVPNSEGDGRVLILAGANNTGTEAAGEFITSSRQVASLMKRLGMPGPKLDAFDALIQVNSIARVPRDATVAVCRVLPPMAPRALEDARSRPPN